jgi:hypothetical protein
MRKMALEEGSTIVNTGKERDVNQHCRLMRIAGHG